MIRRLFPRLTVLVSFSAILWLLLLPPISPSIGHGGACGDGTVDGGEDCDDGNIVDGDCCAGDCTLEVPASPCATDGDVCTDDICDGAGTCTHQPNTAPCSDGLFCNGTEVCTDGICSQHSGNPCAGGAVCNTMCNEAADDCFNPPGASCPGDGDPCTEDSCNGAGTCIHPTIPGCMVTTSTSRTTSTSSSTTSSTSTSTSSTTVATLPPSCTPSPKASCHAPARHEAKLQLRDRFPDDGDLVSFKWAHGETTTFAELGDPVHVDAYAICIYGASGTLVLQAMAPAGGTCPTRACWSPQGNVIQGYKYTDSERTPDGLSKLQLKSGPTGVAQAKVMGKGTRLPTLDLPLVLPAKVQIQATTGACWTATFSTQSLLRNDGEQFNGKSD